MNKWEVRDEDIIALRNMWDLNEHNFKWGYITIEEYERTKSKLIARTELLETIKGY